MTSALVSDLIAARALHTPGPWRVAQLNLEGLHANDGSTSILAGDDGICSVSARTPFKRGDGNRHVCAERDANARLIAAAPELKDALAAMLDCWGGYECPEVDAAILVMQKLGEDRWSMQAQMDAEAISKALGELHD